MRKDWNRKPIIDTLPQGKRRILLRVSYDGSGFAGFQMQNNAVSVASCLQEAIKKITKEEVVIVSSGRTDSGVHAIGQYCHFDTSSAIESKKFADAIKRDYKSACPTTRWTDIMKLK